VRPDFQEIDRSDLIVELSIPEVRGCPPGQLGRLVEHISTDLEVLSSWNETEPACPSGQHERPRFVDKDDPTVPFTARRAFDDGLPTASWHSSSEVDVPHWFLAVPALSFDDRMVAAIRRRRGYSYRFSALEAAALRASLGWERTAC
jgi:hypothetical protein